MKVFQKIAVLCLFVYMPFAGNAWGVTGHRIVGHIADGYLTKKAKAELGKILGFESIATASNWPDFIKSDPAYNYLSTWHYVNLKSGLSFNEVNNFLTADTATDAYTKINFLIKEFKTNRLLSAETKQLYVRLLIHIIGDIHQPMHLGRPDDRGGNAVKVRWFSDEANLHSVWDSKLIDFQQLSYTEYAAAINHTTLAQRKAWQKQTLVEWMFDTYGISKTIFYSTPN